MRAGVKKVKQIQLQQVGCQCPHHLRVSTPLKVIFVGPPHQLQKFWGQKQALRRLSTSHQNRNIRRENVDHCKESSNVGVYRVDLPLKPFSHFVSTPFSSAALLSTIAFQLNHGTKFESVFKHKDKRWQWHLKIGSMKSNGSHIAIKGSKLMLRKTAKSEQNHRN